MSYTMTMEPEIEREATAYASSRGFTMEQLLRFCVENVVREELRKRTERKSGYGLVEFMRSAPEGFCDLDFSRDPDDGSSREVAFT